MGQSLVTQNANHWILFDTNTLKTYAIAGLLPLLASSGRYIGITDAVRTKANGSGLTQSMARPDEKSKGRITIPIFKEPPQSSAERPNVPSMRTQDELMPLALRITENAELMHRFRAVMGSDNEDQARNLVYEITKYAQSLDETITGPEGTRIVLVLMKMVGLSRERAQ